MENTCIIQRTWMLQRLANKMRLWDKFEYKLRMIVGSVFFANIFEGSDDSDSYRWKLKLHETIFVSVIFAKWLIIMKL